MYLAKKLHLHPGTPVVLDIENGILIIRPPQYDLDTKLDGITSNNKNHLLVDDDKIGLEEW